MAAELIKVEVSRRILHIGSAAYPLQNIARVESQELKWVRWPAIKSFLKAFVIWQYYALIIDTAGSARAALVNPDRMLISDLVPESRKRSRTPMIRRVASRH